MTERRQFCLRGHDTAIVGRDSSGRCLACKRVAMRDAYARRVAEEAAAERAIREAELRRRREEHDRQAEREYQAAIAAGGDAAAEARWDRLFTETLEETGSRYGLCQWALDNGHPGACMRRTIDVYCHVHNRQLERESLARRKAEAAPRKEQT